MMNKVISNDKIDYIANQTINYSKIINMSIQVELIRK